MKLMLVLLTKLFILTRIVIANSSNEERLPPLWNEAPSSIADYPIAADYETQIIDPWLYLHRLGMYKILIDTTTPLMPFCSSNETNILFGLPSQFGWQFTSNRLFSNGTRNVSTDSWWGSANYYLSVIPFIAAADAGVINQGSFRILQRENFCTNSDECSRQVPNAMNKWRSFFTNLLNSSFCLHEKYDARIVDKCYLAPLWSAHMASLDGGLPLIESKVSLLPSHMEQRFGLSWAHLVQFIALSRLDTNLPLTNKYQAAYLPFRMLRDEDKPPHCSDLPDTVNQALELLFLVDEDWWSPLVKIWEKVTCNFEARQASQHVLETVVQSIPEAAGFFIEATIDAVQFKCDE
ncbi:unnamed protein product [Rotaria socialis]|uniref:Uncharacterized protein n=2 Tax=Rotaria socialis TaxID=392032 RepID=A0A820A7P5_9BILA|nr:unnamed protein product [Rotaria socialis]CAF4188772.1 unnamed protein product [Rotaria socialis]